MSTSRLRPALVPILVVAQLLVAPGASRAADPEVTCRACLVVDDGGKVLFARDADTSLPNASTTKMTTALVVRQHARLGEDVQISGTAASVGGGGLDLSPGGGYDVEELLLALLLTSSNEAAVALAEHVGGNEAAFVREMNAYARDLGTKGTAFVTSHGLDAPGHHSTARDLALIGAELLEDPVLAEMVATAHSTIEGPTGAVAIDNRNLLLEGYRGAIGIKTGFTALAGNVLVAAARRSGRTVITVVMDSVDAAADSAVLLDLGFEQLSRGVMVPAAAQLAGLVFEGAGSTGVIAARTVRGLAKPTQIEVTFVAAEGIALPIEPGDAVGVLEIRDRGGRLLSEVDAIAERGVAADEPSFWESGFSSLLRGVASLLGGT